MTSSEYSDETVPAIKRILETLGEGRGEEGVAPAIGHVALPAEYVQHTAIGVPSITGNPQLEATYRGLADEILLSAGRSVTDELRNALAEHLGSGVLMAVEGGGRPEDQLGEDLAGQFLEEARNGVRDGTLLLKLIDELEEFKRFQENSRRPPRTFIGRWRQQRAEAAAAEQKLAERQAELQNLRVRTRDQGYLTVGDLQPDDEIILSMRTHRVDPKVAKASLHGTVEGFETIEEGRYAGRRGIVVRVLEEERTRKKSFVGEPLPEDSRVILLGTGLPSNFYAEHSGRITHDQAPIILWRGRPRTITVRSEYFGGDTRNLHLDQFTINGTTMLPDELPPLSEN